MMCGEDGDNASIFYGWGVHPLVARARVTHAVI